MLQILIRFFDSKDWLIAMKIVEDYEQDSFPLESIGQIEKVSGM